jgi:Domain of Unknown Function (DUF1206)
MTLLMSSQTGSGAVRQVEQAATALPEEASEVRSEHWFQRFAKAGLATRAVIYVLLAYIAADLALRHNSSAEANGSGALSEIGRQPAGRALLGLLAIGLVGYATWRVAQALSRDKDAGAPQAQQKDRPERQPVQRDQPAKSGRSAKNGQSAKKGMSLLERLGWMCTAILYFALCAQAVSLAVSSNASNSGGGGPSSHPQPFVATALRWPAGPLWVGLAGAGIAIGGAVLVVWGCLHDYGEVLETQRMGQAAYWAARVTGAAGEAKRGLLIMLFSAYLLAAAVDDSPSQAKDPNGALLSFNRLPAGHASLLAAVVGLLCFAAYSVFESIYRRV